MKFSDLRLLTYRAAPSEFRSEGYAFLYRAGYISRSGELLSLGQSAVQRLRHAYVSMESSDKKIDDLLRILALPFVYSEDSGEYFVFIDKAEEEILFCPTCKYASRRELARANRTPFSSEAPLPLEKVLTPDCNTIAKLSQLLDIPQEKTAKALMYTRLQDGKFVFVVVRGDLQISEAKLKACVGEVQLATADQISASGAVAGYASPIGLQDALVVVDELVSRSPNLVAGANVHGYHLKNTNFSRDYSATFVVDVTFANPGDHCSACGVQLELRTAVVVYSKGELSFENLFYLLAEIYHDEKGLTFPRNAVPFDIYLMNVPGKEIDTLTVAEKLHSELLDAGASVLFDDRNERAGVKFNDADLIGCPVRVTVGERGLQTSMVEIKNRLDMEVRQIPLNEVISHILSK